MQSSALQTDSALPYPSARLKLQVELIANEGDDLRLCGRCLDAEHPSGFLNQRTGSRSAARRLVAHAAVEGFDIAGLHRKRQGDPV